MKRLKRLMIVAAVASAAAVAITAIGGVFAIAFERSDIFDEYAPSGGALSPYLVGYYDDRDHGASPGDGGSDEHSDTTSSAHSDDLHDVEPVLYLVNPTSQTLTAYIVIFDRDGAPEACRRRVLDPNDLTDVMLGDISGDNDEFGAVKVVTFDEEDPGITVAAGLSGWISHYIEHDVFDDDEATLMREHALEAVPQEVLFADLDDDGESDELERIVTFVEDDEDCRTDGP